MTNSKKIPTVLGKYCLVTEPNDVVKLSEQDMSNESLAEVFAVGEEVSEYKKGDKVLIDKNKCVKIKKFFDRVYWKVHKDFIICGIVEEHDSI